MSRWVWMKWQQMTLRRKGQEMSLYLGCWTQENRRLSRAMYKGKDLGWKISQFLESAKGRSMSASQERKRKNKFLSTKLRF